MEKIKITWYGHCTFLLELGETKILIDPYDHFNNIYIGNIEADYLLLSSMAHDHGNIAASPHSWTHHHSGKLDIKEGITIYGVETKEYRGTPKLIFDIKYKDFLITNFADLGDPKSLEQISEEDKEILQQTNIALMRYNVTLNPNVHSYDLSLKLCDPQIIIPIHFYPKSFIHEQVPTEEQKGHLDKFMLIEEMFDKLANYQVVEIDSYEKEISDKELEDKTILYFQQIHPQVKYKNHAGAD